MSISERKTPAALVLALSSCIRSRTPVVFARADRASMTLSSSLARRRRQLARSSRPGRAVYPTLANARASGQDSKTLGLGCHAAGVVLDQPGKHPADGG